MLESLAIVNDLRPKHTEVRRLFLQYENKERSVSLSDLLLVLVVPLQAQHKNDVDRPGFRASRSGLALRSEGPVIGAFKVRAGNYLGPDPGQIIVVEYKGRVGPRLEIVGMLPHNGVAVCLVHGIGDCGTLWATIYPVSRRSSSAGPVPLLWPRAPESRRTWLAG